MPRVVTLIASATEIVCALGQESALVGRSHECDFPPAVKSLPVCTEPTFDVDGSSGDIDRRVKGVLEQALSVYRVHADLLRELRPDVIVTQSHCDVCAVSDKDVDLALGDWPGPRPRVVSLAPNDLTGVWDSIRQVASALDVPDRGAGLVRALQRRVAEVRTRAAAQPRRPTVACLEWLDPLMAAGNWVPELVQLAGGENLFGEAGKHSPWMTWEGLCERDPDVIVALPCGFDLPRTRAEMAALRDRPGWAELSAVRTGRVAVADGNQFFNRPGPRLVESLEVLAEIFHGPALRFGHEGPAWQRY